jgi:Flp pilus assembly pilin Flp
MSTEPLKNRIASFIRSEESPTFFEYGLLVIVIALVVVVGATVFGSAIEQMFQGAAAYSN